MRRISGDIQGGLWMEQNSDSLSRFGWDGQQPQYLEYYYDADYFDTEELKSLILKLNDFAKYVGQMLEGDDVIESSTQVGKSGQEVCKEDLLRGLDMDILFNTPNFNVVVEEFFDFIHAFNEWRDDREYSIHGLRFKNLYASEGGRDKIDEISEYIEENKLMSDLADAIFGSEIYCTIKRTGQCNFTVEI